MFSIICLAVAIVSLLIATYWAWKEDQIENYIRRFVDKGVQVSIHHRKTGYYEVEINHTPDGRETQHASFSGTNLLKLLEEAWQYILTELKKLIEGYLL